MCRSGSSLTAFRKIVHERVSVQRFLKDALPEGKVEELLELAQRAPSSFNIQPFVAIIGTYLLSYLGSMHLSHRHQCRINQNA
jgi:hypothetical protein